MTARAISAQLVDIRNVGTQKVVKLTIHAPQEQAMQIMELFGWPTGVDPVPVALARLVEQPKGGDCQVAERAKRSWDELSSSVQAGIRCTEPAFHKYLRDRYPNDWARLYDDEAEDADKAAYIVKRVCGVGSRTYIKPSNPKAFSAWQDLDKDYRFWQFAPDVVDDMTDGDK